MTPKNKATEAIKPAAAAKPMLVGAVAGLLLISVFVFGAHNPDPAWGRYWMIRPLVVVPLAGAMGGLFFYLMRWLSARGSVHKAVALLLSLVVFVIGLWLGVVLGLDGTMWD